MHEHGKQHLARFAVDIAQEETHGKGIEKLHQIAVEETKADGGEDDSRRLAVAADSVQHDLAEDQLLHNRADDNRNQNPHQSTGVDDGADQIQLLLTTARIIPGD